MSALVMAGPDSAAAADVAAPGPAADEAGAWEQPYPVEPSGVQPEAAEPPAAGAGAAEPEAAEPEMTEPEVTEPEPPEPGAPEPEALETEAFEPEGVEPTALPEADQYHPPTEKSQVPDFEAALAAEQPGAAQPVREATGAAAVAVRPEWYDRPPARMVPRSRCEKRSVRSPRALPVPRPPRTAYTGTPTTHRSTVAG